MKIEVTSGRAPEVSADALVVPVPETKRVPPYLRPFDKALGGVLAQLLEDQDFKGKAQDQAWIPVRDLPARRVLLLGIGAKGKLDTEGLRRLAASSVRALMRRNLTGGALLVPPTRISDTDLGHALAEGAILGAYRFDQYRTGKDLPKPVQSRNRYCRLELGLG